MPDDGIWILDPTGVAEVQRLQMARRPEDLSGLRLGVLWNEKPNGDILMARMQARLQQRYGLRSVLWRQKHSGSEADPQVLRDLVQDADFVLNATAD